MNKKRLKNLQIQVILVVILALLPGYIFGNWHYQRTINITPGTTKKGQTIILELNETTIDYSHAQSNGEDIRFYSLEGDLLNHYIEFWNDSGDSRVFITIPDSGINAIIMLTWMKNEEIYLNCFNLWAHPLRGH